MPNHLLGQTSPYLLQHVNNPVNWYPWCEEAWEKARRENKLVLVSIGYSACHWCHVMEHESFENEATAQLMNNHYVCIKVDREERPDIDQVYMAAVQLMTGQGGWPLNCFALPDGRPLYGGTYFPNHVWNDLLVKLHDFYTNDPVKAHQYATELTTGLHRSEAISLPVDEPFRTDLLPTLIDRWKKNFDPTEGGPNRAPKFPLPNNYEFLLHYQSVKQDDSILEHVLLTLDKMAMGGIYDQLGGGFARYSVDTIWKVPHFEKMLYDNAQLVSLYSKAYRVAPSTLYRETVQQTLAFIDRELLAPEGVCYSALDADSEGVEGKFYTWTEEELSAISWPTINGINTELIFRDYYSIHEKGLWEHGRFIPLRSESNQAVADRHAITVDQLNSMLTTLRELLLPIRNQRIRPGLDNKILLSWNALMISAWCDAFDTFRDEIYLHRAEQCATWLLKHFRKTNGALLHAGVTYQASGGPGFLEDYALLAQACIALYRSTLSEKWIHEARSLTDYALTHFNDPDSSCCYYTSDQDPKLVTRKTELHDNVLPASNSVLAKVLFQLGHYFSESSYLKRSQRMLQCVAADMANYGSAYSNWAQLLLWFTEPFRELVITGPASKNYLRTIQQQYLPQVLTAATTDINCKLPLFQDRILVQETRCFVCTDHTCLAPVTTIEEALEQLLNG